jgi:cytochrome c oxidase subunit 2
VPRKSLVARLRKGFIPLAAAASAPLFFTQNAWAGMFSPEHGGSPNADDIHSLYMILFLTGVVVFFLVEGLLIYTLWKFKASRGHEAQQIHGNTRLEIGLTGSAFVLVMILAIVSLFKLGAIKDPPNSDAAGYKTTLIAKDPGSNQKLPPNGRALHIIISAFQYGWRYTYDDGNPVTPDPYAYHDLYAPTNTTVMLDITSQDVIHSWWIPQLGGKFDAVPGFHNWTWFKMPADQAGKVFYGQCSQLCGRNHANMTATVHALSPADFTKWLADKQAQLQQAKIEGAKQRAIVNAGETLK